VCGRHEGKQERRPEEGVQARCVCVCVCVYVCVCVCVCVYVCMCIYTSSMMNQSYIYIRIRIHITPPTGHPCLFEWGRVDFLQLSQAHFTRAPADQRASSNQRTRQAACLAVLSSSPTGVCVCVCIYVCMRTYMYKCVFVSSEVQSHPHSYTQYTLAQSLTGLPCSDRPHSRTPAASLVRVAGEADAAAAAESLTGYGMSDSHTHAYTYTLILTLTLTLTHTRVFSPMHAWMYECVIFCNHPFYLSPTHKHTHTFTLNYTNTFTLNHTHTHSNIWNRISVSDGKHNTPTNTESTRQRMSSISGELNAAHGNTSGGDGSSMNGEYVYLHVYVSRVI
jgi:hypothetical protein